MATIDTSGIDITKPESGEATTQSVRDNTSAIKTELAKFESGNTIEFDTVEIHSPGTETSGININGVNYSYCLRVNDIGGDHPAEVIFHRHSTTYQPLLLAARSNSDTEAHSAVTAGQSLFSTISSGYTGTHYDLFGEARFYVGTGTVSATSSPGAWKLLLTPDGSNVPAAVITADSDKSVTFAGNVSATCSTLSTAAESDGNVSAYRMTTGTATANYYSDLATIDLGSLDNADIVLNLLLTCGKGTSLTSVLLEVICKQTTVISDTESKINVISISDTTNITYNDFFLAASATTKGTDIHLWMQSIGAVEWQVQELSRHVNSDATTPISYNDAATWTATDPLTGPPAIDVTSDWAGSGKVTPTTFVNSWADYGGTHPCAYEIDAQGWCNLAGWVKDGTTTSNTTIFTLPVAPDIDLRFNGVNSSGTLCTITVDTSGNVKTAIGASATYTGLDGIRFRIRS